MNDIDSKTRWPDPPADGGMAVGLELDPDRAEALANGMAAAVVGFGSPVSGRVGSVDALWERLEEGADRLRKLPVAGEPMAGADLLALPPDRLPAALRVEAAEAGVHEHRIFASDTGTQVSLLCRLGSGEGAQPELIMASCSQPAGGDESERTTVMRVGEAWMVTRGAEAVRQWLVGKDGRAEDVGRHSLESRAQGRVEELLAREISPAPDSGADEAFFAERERRFPRDRWNEEIRRRAETPEDPDAWIREFLTRPDEADDRATGPAPEPVDMPAEVAALTAEQVEQVFADTEVGIPDIPQLKSRLEQSLENAKSALRSDDHSGPSEGKPADGDGVCPHCSTPLDRKTRFCPQCGTPLT